MKNLHYLETKCILRRQCISDVVYLRNDAFVVHSTHHIVKLVLQSINWEFSLLISKIFSIALNPLVLVVHDVV